MKQVKIDVHSKVPVKRRHHVGTRMLLVLAALSIVIISTSCVVTWAVTKSMSEPLPAPYSDEQYVLTGGILSLMNRSVDPCQDFHQYACGGWISQQWEDSTSRRVQQVERVNKEIKSLLSEERSSEKLSEQNLRNTYKSCLEEVSDDRTLNSWLQSVDAQSNIADVFTLARTLVPSAFVRLGRDDEGVLVMKANNRIKQSINLEGYRAHITTLLALQNSTEDVTRIAEEIITFEQYMANYIGVEDSANIAELEGITALTKMNLTAAVLASSMYLTPDTNVAFNRAYLTDLDKNISAMGNRALPFIKVYTKVVIQLAYAKDSSTAYRASHRRTFPYFPHNLPRDQECFFNVGNFLGFSIGALYINSKSNSSKSLRLAQLTKEMSGNIKETFTSRIETMAWLEKETIKGAKDKLDHIVEMIGAPPWINNDTHLLTINYGGTLTPDDFVMNYKELDHDKTEKQLKLQTDPHTDLWEKTLGPQEMLNALYFPRLNAINVPSGAMMEPWVDSSWPRSMRYGALGSVIAHEYTHGFDSLGAQYDAAGQERNWWDDSDLVEFDNKKECFKNQYGKFSLHGMQVDGAETLNENIADNGGLELSFESYKAAVDGFDYSLPGLESDEMFFLAYAQMWCDVTNKDWYLNGDAHSPMKYRIIGVLQNSKSFSNVFKCKAGSAMNPAKKCKIW